MCGLGEDTSCCAVIKRGGHRDEYAYSGRAWGLYQPGGRRGQLAAARAPTGGQASTSRRRIGQRLDSASRSGCGVIVVCFDITVTMLALLYHSNAYRRAARGSVRARAVAASRIIERPACRGRSLPYPFRPILASPDPSPDLLFQRDSCHIFCVRFCCCHLRRRFTLCARQTVHCFS